MGANKAWTVEKFVPRECPKCSHEFEKEGADWSLFLGDIRNGKPEYRVIEGCETVICSACGNYTARVVLEPITSKSESKARKLLDEGFTNLHEVELIGGEDLHVVSGHAFRMESDAS